MMVSRASSAGVGVWRDDTNTEKDREWLRSHGAPGAEIHDLSEEISLIAVQGPKAAELLASLVEADLDTLKHFRFTEAPVAGGGDRLAHGVHGR
jgi:aminomethyltransferase